jgi:hypothetical protein
VLRCLKKFSTVLPGALKPEAVVFSLSCREFGGDCL